MDTVLVTGAAGFIGSNLVSALLKKGYRVVGIDNFDDTYDPALKENHIASFLENKNFVLYRVDIRDVAAVQEIFQKEKPKFVAHLAAKADTRAAVDEPHVYVDNNINGTLNVLDAARAIGVENTVFASSSSVYGNSTVVPWQEEASAGKPISPYGATKRAGELFAYSYHHNFGMNITCLRYFNVYGEHNRPTMVPYIWAHALLNGLPIEISGEGTRKRDYTYIGDTVNATISALEKPLGFEIINVGNNNPLSLNELLAVFEKATGKKAQIKRRESHRASVEETYADISKAAELLNWKPEVSIEDGVSRLVSWMRDNGL